MASSALTEGTNDKLVEEELASLTAIYVKEVTIYRDKISQSTVVVYDENDEKLKISFTLSELYPSVAPAINVFFNGVANKTIANKLMNATLENLGTAMMFKLISSAQEIVENLHENEELMIENKPIESSREGKGDDVQGKNTCEKGQGEEPILKEPDTWEKCKFFLQGKCRFGDKCRNLHGKGQDVSKKTEKDEKSTKIISESLHQEDKQLCKNEGKSFGRKGKTEKPGKCIKQKQQQQEDPKNEKKKSMKTATDVIHRILWDDALPTENFIVGYLDRFIGVVEKPFVEFSWEDLATVDYNVLAIPKHRIQYFKYFSTKVWDKTDRMDKIFGSTGDKESVFDIINKYVYTSQEQNNTKRNSRINEDTPQKIYDESNKPNHFICLRITNQNIKENIMKVQSHISKLDERLNEVLHDSDRLHVTLCMLRLDTDQEKEKACEVLRSLETLLTCIVPSNVYNVSVRYVDHFRQSVIHAKVQNSPELAKLAEMLQSRLKDAGINLCGNYDVYNPHVTFLKLTRPFSKQTHINKIALRTFSDLQNIQFGAQRFDSIRLCETGPERGEDKFYVTLATIQNNLLCISPKLPQLISNRISKLMKNGQLDENVADELLDSILSGDKQRFEEAVLKLEQYISKTSPMHEKRIVILRGLPGSGKTFLANQLQQSLVKNNNITTTDHCSKTENNTSKTSSQDDNKSDNNGNDNYENNNNNNYNKPSVNSKKNTVEICSADNYFEQETSGSRKGYKFSGKDIASAHEYCRNQFIDAVANSTDLIIVDNTHVQRWEYRIYERIARLCEYTFRVVEIECKADSIRHEFLKRGLHNVTNFVHEEMHKKWENDPQAVLCVSKEIPFIGLDWVFRESEDVILYSALYLDKQSRDLLLNHYPATFRNVYSDHMTILYQPDKKHIHNLPIGESRRVMVDGYYCRGGLQVVSVFELEDKLCLSDHPHITISTHATIPPKSAKDALDSCACSPVKCDIILTGVVGMQIMTGPKESVSCTDKYYIIQNILQGELLSREGDGEPEKTKSERTTRIQRSNQQEDSDTSADSEPEYEASLYTGPSAVKRLYIFDFDATLFHTPDPASGRNIYEKLTGTPWPHKGWLNHSASLAFPLHIHPGPMLPEYWDYVGRSCSYTVLCTGRLEQGREGVEGVLNSFGMSFDRVILKPDDNEKYSRSNVSNYKKNTVMRLLKEFPQLEEVKFWDDRIDNVNGIKAVSRKYPAVRFDLFQIKVKPTESLLKYTNTTEVFQRLGLTPSVGYRAAVRESVEIIRRAWCDVLGKECHPTHLQPFGSFLLNRRSDVDLCIIAPMKKTVDGYISLLAEKLETYGIKFVHCVTGIRCPRIKVKFTFCNSAPVEFDIVVACVLPNDDVTEFQLDEASQNSHVDKKSKIALEGLVFYDTVVVPATAFLNNTDFGLVIEALVTILRKRNMKGNAFHCIRTFHLVQLLAEFLVQCSLHDGGGKNFESWLDVESVKDFEKFLKKLLKYFSKLSHNDLKKLFKGFVPDSYIAPLLNCFEEAQKLTLDDMLLAGPRLNHQFFTTSKENPTQVVRFTVEEKCAVKIWKCMTVLEAKVSTLIRQLIDSGVEVLPRESIGKSITFFTKGHPDVVRKLGTELCRDLENKHHFQTSFNG